MSECDLDELIATRRLHGLDDNLFKESDKNVANEEVIHNKNKYIYIKEVAERIRNEYREKYKDLDIEVLKIELLEEK